MGTGAYLEPLVVVVLLFGGAWLNRLKEVSFSTRKSQWRGYDPITEANAALRNYHQKDSVDTVSELALSPPLLASHYPWRTREIKIFGLQRQVISPNTTAFRNRFLSRVLRKFPFLVECWYWALIYWVSQTSNLPCVHVKLTPVPDLPAWTCFHSSHPSTRHRSHRPQTCPTIDRD